MANDTQGVYCLDRGLAASKALNANATPYTTLRGDRVAWI